MWSIGAFFCVPRPSLAEGIQRREKEHARRDPAPPMLDFIPMSSTWKRWAGALLALGVVGAAALFFLRPGLFQPPERRVIVVGLDAADWQLLDGYCVDGTMPNLARLVREGRSGVLKTFQPPLSPLVWTTMMTGVSPRVHGILDFTRFNPRSGQKEPITSDERREPAVWNMASAAGRRVGVLGLWATYPAEPVSGLLVSDRLFSFLYQEKDPPAGVVYPASEDARARALLQRVEGQVGLAELQAYLPWLDEAEYGRHLDSEDPYGHPVSALRRILVETRVYDELGREFLERERPDLLIAYFQGTDSVGHVFAPYAPPRQPAIPEQDYERYHSVPRAYFQAVDALLGRYRQLAQARGAVLMIASDHGFTWREGRPTKLSSFAVATAAKWHRKEGVYLLWGPGVTAEPGHRQRGKAATAPSIAPRRSPWPPTRAPTRRRSRSSRRSATSGAGRRTRRPTPPAPRAPRAPTTTRAWCSRTRARRTTRVPRSRRRSSGTRTSPPPCGT
jgi:hypothetical protein